MAPMGGHHAAVGVPKTGYRRRAGGALTIADWSSSSTDSGAARSGASADTPVAARSDAAVGCGSGRPSGADAAARTARSTSAGRRRKQAAHTVATSGCAMRGHRRRTGGTAVAARSAAPHAAKGTHDGAAAPPVEYSRVASA